MPPHKKFPLFDSHLFSICMHFDLEVEAHKVERFQPGRNDGEIVKD